MLPLLFTLACSSTAVDSSPISPVLELFPTQGGQGTTLTVRIDAGAAAFSRSTTTLDLGAGISVDELEVDDAWSARAQVSIAGDAQLGLRDVTVSTDGQDQVLTEAFTVISESFQISPERAYIGETLGVVFDGTATSWSSGLSWPSFGEGVDVVDFSVVDGTSATATVSVGADAAPGRRDVEIQEGAGNRLVLPEGFMVDRAAVAATFSPDSGMQGQTLSFQIEARGTEFVGDLTSVTFEDSYGDASDVIVDSVTVIDATSLVGQLTVSNAALPGDRDVRVEVEGGGGVVIPDAFQVLAAPFAIEDVAVELRFYIDREINNATGAIDEELIAYAQFFTPLDPECPSSSGSGSGELGSPSPYDVPEAFGVTGSGETDEDCPTPATWRAGDVVWLEGATNTITLDIVEDDASGSVYYAARDLPLATYVLDSGYDLHTQGDDEEVGEVLLEGVQPTLPVDWSLLTPDLWGNHSHDRARDFCFTWTPAQTYPDASFISTIWSRSSPGPLSEEGWVGYLGAVPWDDGAFCFESAQLAVLAAGTVPLTFYAVEYGPEFGLPGSIYQDNQARSWIRWRGSMVLE